MKEHVASVTSGIEGLTIADGLTSTAGGGIRNINFSDLTLSGVVLTGNRAVGVPGRHRAQEFTRDLLNGTARPPGGVGQQGEGGEHPGVGLHDLGDLGELHPMQTKKPEEFLDAAADCDALLNTYAGPITAEAMVIPRSPAFFSRWGSVKQSGKWVPVMLRRDMPSASSSAALA